MAERSISYGMGLSDQMVNQMLQSDDPGIVAQAQEYVNTARQQQTEKPNILSRIANFLNPFSPAESAEISLSPITGEVVNASQFYPGTNVPIATPFRDMSEMRAANDLVLNKTVVPKQLYENFPFVPNTNTGIATIDLSGLPVNMGVANEPDVAQVPLNKGIPFGTRAKDFLTKTVPNVISSAVNFIPGMRFLQSMDRFDTLPYQDRQFIKSAMDMKGIPGSGIFVDPNTGLLKDTRGKNVRSLFGNYAESIDKDYEKLEKSLEESKQNWKNKYGSLNNVNQFGKNWNEMNKRRINNFNFLSNMKNQKDAQTRDLLDKIAKQVKSGVTAKMGKSLHGGDKKSKGDGGGGGFSTPAGKSTSYEEASRSFAEGR